MHGEAVVQRSRDVVRCACVDVSAAGIALFSTLPARARDRVRIQTVIGGATLTLDAAIVRSKKSNGGHLWALRFGALNAQTRAHIEAFVAQQLANAARVRQAELFKARMKQAGVPVVQPQVPPMAAVPSSPVYPGQAGVPDVRAAQPSATQPAPSASTQPASSPATQPSPAQPAAHEAMKGKRRPSGIDLPAPSDPLDVASFQAGAVPVMGGNVLDIEPLAAFDPSAGQSSAPAAGLPEVVEDSVSLSLPEAPPPMGLEPSSVMPPSTPAPFDPHSDAELDDSELSAVAPSFGAHASASEESALLGNSMAFVPSVPVEEPDDGQTRRLDPEVPPADDVEDVAAAASQAETPASAEEFAANAATFVEPTPGFAEDDDEVTRVSIKAPPPLADSSPEPEPDPEPAIDVTAVQPATLPQSESVPEAAPADQGLAFEPGVASFAEPVSFDSDAAFTSQAPPHEAEADSQASADIEDLAAALSNPDVSAAESDPQQPQQDETQELPATLEMVLPAAKAAVANADVTEDEAGSAPEVFEPAPTFDVSGEPFVDERTVARPQLPAAELPEVGSDEPAGRPFLGVSEPGLYDDLPAAVGVSPKQRSAGFDRYATLKNPVDDAAYLGDVQAVNSDLTPTGAKQWSTDEVLPSESDRAEAPTEIRPPGHGSGDYAAAQGSPTAGIPTQMERVAPTGPVEVDSEFTPAPQPESEAYASANLDRGNHPTDVPGPHPSAHEQPTEPGYNVIPQFESAGGGPPAFTEVASIPPAQTGNTMIASLESLGITPAHMRPNAPSTNVPTAFPTAPVVPDTGDAPADFSVVPSFGAPPSSGAGFTIVASTDSMLVDGAGVAMAPPPAASPHEPQAPAVAAQPRSPGLEEFATSLYTPSPAELSALPAAGSNDETRPLSIDLAAGMDEAFTSTHRAPGVPVGVSEVELTAMRVKPADAPVEGAGFELNPRADAKPAPAANLSVVEQALAQLKAKTEKKRAARTVGPSEDAATAKLKTVGKAKGKSKGTDTKPATNRRKRRSLPSNAEANAAAMADPRVYELYKQALTDIDSSR